MVVWTKLSAAQWLDAWEERFAGNPNLVIEWIKGGRSIRVQVYCGDAAEAEAIRERFGGSVRVLRHSDWQQPERPEPRHWKVRDSLLLTNETRAPELAALRREAAPRQVVSIPAEMAFGTGDHATTSTCLRLLADIARERRGSDWEIADLGAGTGVLAIAARLLGAQAGYACDFDPFAVAAAERNAERNGVVGLEIREQDVLRWKPRKQGYDVVAANLFSTVLIEAWPVIVRSLGSGGDLVVSGILASQAWEVFEAAARHGLGFPQVVRKGKWVTARGGHMADLIRRGAAGEG